MLVVSSEHARSSAARLSISTLGQFIFRRDQSVELQSEVSDFGLRQKLKTLISAKDKLTQCIPQNVHCLFFWNYSVKSRPIVTNFGTQNSEKIDIVAYVGFLRDPVYTKPFTQRFCFASLAKLLKRFFWSVQTDVWSALKVLMTMRHLNLRFTSHLHCITLPKLFLSENCCQFSVAVFKSRLKTFLFSQAFSSFSAH